MEKRFRTSTADGAVVEFGLVRHALLAKLAAGVLRHEDVCDAHPELLRAAQPAAQLQLVPGMNHVLVDVPLDMQANAASYADPNKVLAPALTLGVGEFLRAQLR